MKETKKTSIKSKILSFLRELFIVFIGVTAAFVISSRAEKTQQNTLKKNVLDVIKQEQTSNVGRIKIALKANKLMLANYDTIIEKLGSPNSSITIHVNKSIFNDMGFDLAVQSRILSTLHFDVFKDISWCYKLQKSTIELESAYTNFLNGNNKTLSSTAERRVYYMKAQNLLRDVIRSLEMQQKDSQSLIDKL